MAATRPHLPVRWTAVVVPVVVVAMLTALAPSAAALSWRTSGTTRWAHGCDWTGNDIGSTRVPAAHCGGACERVRACSHFAWTAYRGGTCWLKGGPPPRLGHAVGSAAAGAVCGVVGTKAAAAPAVGRGGPTTTCSTSYRVGVEAFCFGGSGRLDVVRLRTGGKVSTIRNIKCDERGFYHAILDAAGPAVTAHVEVAHGVLFATLRDKNEITWRFAEPARSGTSAKSQCWKYKMHGVYSTSEVEPCYSCMTAGKEPWCRNAGRHAGEFLRYKVWAFQTRICR